MVQEKHVGGTVRYRIAGPRARVRRDVDRGRLRSADRTERAALATAHGAVAVMTMHLTTA
jgi:hypothetical protein